MFKRGIILAAALLALAGIKECSAQTSEYRAIWVDAWHTGFKNSTQCDQLIANAKACNANALLIQARRRGDTYYPSGLSEPFVAESGYSPSFDALAYIIQKAHNSSPRIEVHFWTATLPVAGSTIPSDPNHPYNRYPQYLSRDDVGSTFGYENYWFDPGHPEAEQYLYNVFMDVVNRYDVDGIHFDYIRFGGNHWGYNPTSVARFNAAYVRSGQPVYTDDQWEQWRRDQVTNLVRKVYANALAVKPGIKVSASTIPWGSAPGNWYSSSAYSGVFQDWVAWMSEGILDLNVPMVYADCDSSGWDRLTGWKCWTADHQGSRMAIIGLGACSAASCLGDQVNEVRTPCPSSYRLSGQSMYSYACADINLLHSVWPTYVPAPAMTWKTTPTKGHIKGSVTYGGAWLDGATINLTGTATRTTKADGTGFFAFIDLLPGSYTVTASKSGYGTKNTSVNVTAGTVSTADINFIPTNLTISNVQVTGETGSSVTITWTTNAGSTSQVAYGIDKDCSSYTTEDAGLVMSHSVTVTGLQPLTGYYFKVISRNPDTPVAMSAVYAFVTSFNKPDIIMDNWDASYSGSWWTGAYGNKYGTDYHVCTTVTGSPGKTATYRPNIPAAGNYRVHIWYSDGANRPTDAPYTINYSGGSQLYPVNQESNGGKWNLLATKPFVAGTSGSVVIANNSAIAAENVIADAVRFELVTETTPPSVPLNLTLQVISHEQINLTWTASTDSSGVGGYRIIRDGAVVGFSTTTSYADTGLLGNKQYTYNVSAYDTMGNKSGNSTSRNAVTRSVPPSFESISCSKAAGVWHSTNPFVFTSVGGFGPGAVAYYSYQWDTEPTHVWTGSEWSWAAGTISQTAAASAAPYYLHIRGYNSQGIANGYADLGPYYFDDSAPGTPLVSGQYLYTGPTSITADVDAQDTESGIGEIQYAVGTVPGDIDVLEWTNSGPVPQIVIPGLSLTIGQPYYVSVQAKNAAGLWGGIGSSGAITAAQPVGTIPELRSVPQNTPVILMEKVISANFGTEGVYAQELDRSAGIKVAASTVSAPGSLARIAGRYSASGGTGVLDAGEATSTGGGSPLVPLWMQVKSLVGADAPGGLLGVTDAFGPYNVGLLVKASGKVGTTGAGWFTLEDGSGASVKVYSAVIVGAGDVAAVTGISLWELDGTERIRVIKTRDANDVTVFFDKP